MNLHDRESDPTALLDPSAGAQAVWAAAQSVPSRGYNQRTSIVSSLIRATERV